MSKSLQVSLTSSVVVKASILRTLNASPVPLHVLDATTQAPSAIPVTKAFIVQGLNFTMAIATNPLFVPPIE